jgi:hypothetical protein
MWIGCQAGRVGVARNPFISYTNQLLFPLPSSAIFCKLFFNAVTEPARFRDLTSSSWVLFGMLSSAEFLDSETVEPALLRALTTSVLNSVIFGLLVCREERFVIDSSSFFGERGDSGECKFFDMLCLLPLFPGGLSGRHTDFS